MENVPLFKSSFVEKKRKMMQYVRHHSNSGPGQPIFECEIFSSSYKEYEEYGSGYTSRYWKYS